MQKTLAYIALVLILVLGILVGYWFRGLRIRPDVPPDVKPDTLWLHDTVRIPKPYPVKEQVTDTFYLAYPVPQKDTVYIPLPITSKEYHGEDYDAWVSGYRPSLDSIYIYHKTAIVEVPVIKEVHKKWGVGIQAGATYLPNTGFTPYVGVGISYNLLTF